MVVVDRNGSRRVTRVIDARVRAHHPHRRNAVVQAHRGQRRIPARTQDDAPAAEMGVIADLPPVAHHHDRRGAVIEAVALEIVDSLLRGEVPALEAVVLVKGDLCGRLGRDGQAGHRQRVSQNGIHRFLLNQVTGTEANPATRRSLWRVTRAAVCATSYLARRSARRISVACATEQTASVASAKLSLSLEAQWIARRSCPAKLHCGRGQAGSG